MDCLPGVFRVEPRRQGIHAHAADRVGGGSAAFGMNVPGWMGHAKRPHGCQTRTRHGR
jgi:hypothetical protein